MTDQSASNPCNEPDSDAWYDGKTGTTWTRPTAFAYAMACKARDRYANLYGAAEKSLASAHAVAVERNAVLEEANDAVRRCASLDENGYICEKAEAISAILTLKSSPRPEPQASGADRGEDRSAQTNSETERG